MLGGNPKTQHFPIPTEDVQTNLRNCQGEKNAPIFYNFVMASMEEGFLTTATFQPFLQKRYPDDIFVICTSGKAQLEEFKANPNAHLHQLKSIFDHQGNSVDFLEAIVFQSNIFNTTSVLDIKPHCKPTNKSQYPLYHSC